MQFFVHSGGRELAGALQRHGHTVHTHTDLAEVALAPDTLLPEDLLKHLTTRQWNLLTTDRDLVQAVYELKLSFPNCIVFLQGDSGVDPATAMDRLFERYPRLAPRRLYTITRGRVKIRQLPGRI
ncbi:MAG TPA: hypothetical protein VMG59_12095 [Phycisphaerae bacterium]|nr:hypothetical protein [Phycisphaerae bacterium]